MDADLCLGDNLILFRCFAKTSNFQSKFATTSSNFEKNNYLDMHSCITYMYIATFGGYMLAKPLVVFYVWSPDIFVLFFYQIYFQALHILLSQIKHYHTIPYINSSKLWLVDQSKPCTQYMANNRNLHKFATTNSNFEKKIYIF